MEEIEREQAIAAKRPVIPANPNQVLPSSEDRGQVQFLLPSDGNDLSEVEKKGCWKLSLTRRVLTVTEGSVRNLQATE